LGSQGKGYTRFLTGELDAIVPRNSERGWPQKEAFLYEFQYSKKKIYFKAVVAPGDQDFRQALIDSLAQLDGARKTNSNFWSSVHTENFSYELTSEKYLDEDLLVNVIDKVLDEVEPLVKKISQHLVKELPMLDSPKSSSAS